MKQKKNQKPIEYDLHIKYVCHNCGLSHWLSLKEVKTKNFKVVCDCGLVFKPKRIKKIHIVYTDKKPAKKPVDNNKKTGMFVGDETVRRAIKTMITFGYTKKESVNAINIVYDPKTYNDHISLVKAAVSKLGEI